MKIGDTEIQAIKGNIVEQNDIEVIVNAANAQIQIGGRVAGAIHRAAGPELNKQTLSLPPIKPGDVVITRAYNLTNNLIINVLAPIYGTDEPEEKYLSNCYKNAIQFMGKRFIRVPSKT
jgi:O-acetyl-ADP-ribose deacetylase (regulator of RNase III)